ncbi:MAG: hypothetical protein ACRDZO_20155 [Egibacteraceae bacterium]
MRSNATLWRYRRAQEFALGHETSDAQLALYRHLQRRITQPLAEFDPGDYPMPAAWNEFAIKRHGSPSYCGMMPPGHSSSSLRGPYRPPPGK